MLAKLVSVWNIKEPWEAGKVGFCVEYLGPLEGWQSRFLFGIIRNLGKMASRFLCGILRNLGRLAKLFSVWNIKEPWKAGNVGFCVEY